VLNALNVRVQADAKHDGTWARYVADDCIFSDDIGRVFTKAQFMDLGLASENFFGEQQPKEAKKRYKTKKGTFLLR
jgi:hypothetical protein